MKNPAKFVSALIIFVLLALYKPATAQATQLSNVPQAFNAMAAKPIVSHFKSRFKAPAGGHLQGIQSYPGSTNKNAVILTGSSATYSYYVIAGQGGEAIALKKISDSPFRHAGGCQMAKGRLFVGVEDNQQKDEANVMMDSVVIARRRGSYKRSTAGAVGATMVNGKYVVAVGDWDTRTIDFYLSHGAEFDSVATFSFGSNGPPCSYQSINLLSDSSNRLFLIGTGRQGNLNRADLYAVKNYQPVLLATKLFKSKNGCSFRYGAGINISAAGSLQIYTCQRNLKRHNSINIFGR